MSFFGGLISGLLGGGGGGSASASQSTTNKTEINVDLKPLGEILAQSQKDSASLLGSSLNQSAKTAKDAQAIRLFNDERNRQLEVAKIKNIDTYLEHAKNGLVISSVVVALLYVSKKRK